MEKGHTEGERVFHAKIDGSGRIVIPAEARLRKNAKEGETVVLVEDESGLHVKSLEQVLAEAHAYFKALTPPGVLLSDEVNADRRSESERD